MFNKMQVFIKPNKGLLIGSVVASSVLTVLVLVPMISELIATGLVLFPSVGRLLFSVPHVLPGIVAVLFASVIALLFYLLRVKHSLFVSGVGLSIGYVIFSWVNQISNNSVYLKAIILFIAAFALFYSLAQIGRRIKMHTVASVVLFVVLVVSSVYVTRYIERVVVQINAPALRQAYMDAQNKEFETTKQTIGFKVYYPTYSSTTLPASAPKLNGYSQDQKERTSPHVTYKIGLARVTQSALLKNQDKLMDFRRNCDIRSLSSAMGSVTEISQQTIDRSLQNLSRCKIIHHTSADKDVFYYENGQWSTFYLQNDGTNLLIEFDDINGGKYTDVMLPEVKKVIDSLEPISLNKLQRGNEMLADRY